MGGKGQLRRGSRRHTGIYMTPDLVALGLKILQSSNHLVRFIHLNQKHFIDGKTDDNVPVKCLSKKVCPLIFFNESAVDTQELLTLFS